MPTWPGRFERGQPRLSISIAGPQSAAEEVSAIVDTGFNGFAMIPEEMASRHALEALSASTAGSLADGSRVPFRSSVIRIGFANRTEQGVALLAKDGPVLVGTDFLRKFKLALLMTNTQFWLMDETRFEEIAVASGFARKV